MAKGGRLGCGKFEGERDFSKFRHARAPTSLEVFQCIRGFSEIVLTNTTFIRIVILSIVGRRRLFEQEIASATRRKFN